MKRLEKTARKISKLIKEYNKTTNRPELIERQDKIFKELKKTLESVQNYCQETINDMERNRREMLKAEFYGISERNNWNAVILPPKKK